MGATPQPSIARRGIALFAALALMALIGLLIGGALASSTLTSRSSHASHADALLTSGADFALGVALSNAQAWSFADLSLGRVATFGVVDPNAPDIATTVEATRLARGVMWLVADARMFGAGNARRRVNLVARWRPVGAPPSAALMARGNVRIAAGVVFTSDTTGDADCRSISAVDVIVGPGSMLTSIDSARTNVASVAADSSAYFLRAWQLAALDSGGGGVHHVRGDTTLSGGTVDGILIVDGSLTIAGAVSGTGLIVSRGPVDGRAGSITFTGALLSFAAPAAPGYAIDLGGGSLRFSPCAIAAALRRALPLRPVRQRSWGELY